MSSGLPGEVGGGRSIRYNKNMGEIAESTNSQNLLADLGSVVDRPRFVKRGTITMFFVLAMLMAFIPYAQYWLPQGPSLVTNANATGEQAERERRYLADGRVNLPNLIVVSGGLLGTMVGLALLLRWYGLGNRLHLLMGLAFLANGFEDLQYGLLVCQGIGPLWVSSVDRD